jgi:hypothetical protein
MLVLPCLVVVAVHVLSGLDMEQPIILADELGYLGNARYLSGVGHLPEMQGCQFYHFGYSLFLVPAFWLFSDPVVVYKATTVINSLLVGALVGPLFLLLTATLRVPGQTARWVACACCLYPSLILYSSLAWSESAFVLFAALATALCARYLATKTTRDAVLFSAVAGFLYTIHPRGLPVLAAALVLVVALTCLRAVGVRQLFLSIAVMGSVFVVTRTVNAHLKAIGWGGRGEFSATRLASRIMPDGDFPALLERAMGQLLYLVQASHGLVLVGLVAVAWLVLKGLLSGSLRRTLSDPISGVSVFVLMSAAGIFAASCTSKLYSIHGPHGVRGANFIHGRYNEAFAVVFVAVALAECCRRGRSWRQLLVRAVAVTATVAVLTVVVAAEADDALVRQVAGMPGVEPQEEIPRSQVDAVNVPGVYPLVHALGALDLRTMSVVTVVSFLVVTAVLRLLPLGGVALLGLVFSAFAYLNHRDYLRPAIERNTPRLEFVSRIAFLGPIPAASYDSAHHESTFYYGIQYLMPHTIFQKFESRNQEVPATEVVISGTRWRHARRLGAKFVLAAGRWDNALWLMPGDMQARLSLAVRQGRLLGTGPVLGVQESGFYRPETFGGQPGRWTAGAATLRVPVDASDPPVVLGIETVVPGRKEVRLRVRANAIELLDRRVPGSAWSESLSLREVPITDEVLIEIDSDTFSPADSVDGAGDRRRLGVVVQGIRLAARATLAARAVDGVTLGTEPVFGFQESGFHRSERYRGEPARWTDGAASLRVPLDPRAPPQRVVVETATPGRDGVRLQIVANGTELWHQEIPSGPWSRSLSLEQVALGEELLLELRSDTFCPADRLDGSTDGRSLGVMVRGIRLLRISAED